MAAQQQQESRACGQQRSRVRAGRRAASRTASPPASKSSCTRQSSSFKTSICVQRERGGTGRHCQRHPRLFCWLLHGRVLRNTGCTAAGMPQPGLRAQQRRCPTCAAATALRSLEKEPGQSAVSLATACTCQGGGLRQSQGGLRGGRLRQVHRRAGDSRQRRELASLTNRLVGGVGRHAPGARRGPGISGRRRGRWWLLSGGSRERTRAPTARPAACSRWLHRREAGGEAHGGNQARWCGKQRACKVK